MSRRILTSSAVALIPAFVQRGMRPEQIAEELGCTVGTLRVKCSQLGISLKQKVGMAKQGGRVQRPEAVLRRSTESSQSLVEIRVALPELTVKQLGQRGALKGQSAAALAAELLVVVARDNLYHALLE